MRSDAEYAQKVVSDLDSEMNQFMDSIPEHRTSSEIAGTICC